MLEENNLGMVGREGVPFPIDNNYLDFTTQFMRPLFFKGFYEATLPPMEPPND